VEEVVVVMEVLEGEHRLAPLTVLEEDLEG
jgi:hypothetical protein